MGIAITSLKIWGRGAIRYIQGLKPGEIQPLFFHKMDGLLLKIKALLEKFSTVILTLLLIQQEQLSVAGERMCTKYW